MLKNEEGVEVLVPVIAESSKEDFRKKVQELFNTDRQLAYKLTETFGDLEYGYAITSHKAQGSTYKTVYVMEDNILGSSNGGTIKSKYQSLYVATSRPTTNLIMVSNKNSADKSVQTTIQPKQDFYSDIEQEIRDRELSEEDIKDSEFFKHDPTNIKNLDDFDIFMKNC